MPSTRRWRAGGVKVLRGSPVDVPRREECIEVALSAKLEQREAKREAQAKAAAAEVAAFTLDFKNAARRCFELIDKDEGGTLDKGEIVRAVKEDAEVISFLETCGEENLQFLLVPDRLEASLDALDTSKDGELDIDECTERCLNHDRHAISPVICTQGRARSTKAWQTAWRSSRLSARSGIGPSSRRSVELKLTRTRRCRTRRRTRRRGCATT